LAQELVASSAWTSFGPCANIPIRQPIPGEIQSVGGVFAWQNNCLGHLDVLYLVIRCTTDCCGQRGMNNDGEWLRFLRKTNRNCWDFGWGRCLFPSKGNIKKKV
jgi:hypothetical protein